MTDLMYSAPCPACKGLIGFDPYDGIPAGFGEPFKCPHCGASIELSGEDVDQGGDIGYEYEYEFVRATDY